jgi:hypothetical protein
MIDEVDPFGPFAREAVRGRSTDPASSPRDEDDLAAVAVRIHR